MRSLNKLSDEKLIEAFEMAIEKDLSEDFIKLLESEITSRELVQLIS